METLDLDGNDIRQWKASFVNQVSNYTKKTCRKVEENKWSMPMSFGGLKSRLARAKNKLVPYAYTADAVIYEFFASKQPCEFHVIDETFYLQNYGFALQKNSPYTEAISMALMQLAEQGVVFDAYNKWIASVNECSEVSMRPEARSQGLEDLEGIFLILISSGCISLIMVGVEFVWRSFKGVAEKCSVNGTTIRSMISKQLKRVRRDFCIYY